LHLGQHGPPPRVDAAADDILGQLGNRFVAEAGRARVLAQDGTPLSFDMHAVHVDQPIPRDLSQPGIEGDPHLQSFPIDVTGIAANRSPRFLKMALIRWKAERGMALEPQTHAAAVYSDVPAIRPNRLHHKFYKNPVTGCP
jgi:hypothetical protein